MSRYRVERTLGRGGMATVELARDEQLGRPVAVKRLSESLAGDQLFRERFLREARIAAALSHPNLVGVYDVGEEDGRPYIVMEYVEGETLDDVGAREGRLEPERVTDILLQVCAGLAYAHSAGLVHRDIKPQNLILRRDGVVKIADFGIARTLDATRLTQVGSIVGTAAYLAPEQAAGEEVTPAADLYSVGAVAYELLTGRTPYEFRSLAELGTKRQPPQPIRELAPGVSPQLERAVMSCLAPDPADRPESAAALARDLAEPLTETGATAVMAQPGQTITLSRRALLAIAALLAAVLIAGGLALAYDGDGEEPPPAAPERQDVLPRGDTPAETARLLAEWLRERAG